MMQPAITHIKLIVRNNEIMIPLMPSIIVLFYSPRCAACAQAKAMMDNMLQRTQNCNFYLINVDEEQNAIRLVTKVPTFYGFKGGRPLGSMDSDVTAENLYNFWNKIVEYSQNKQEPMQNANEQRRYNGEQNNAQNSAPVISSQRFDEPYRIISPK